MDRVLTGTEIGELAKKLSPKYQHLVLTNISMLLFQQCCDKERKDNSMICENSNYEIGST